MSEFTTAHIVNDKVPVSVVGSLTNIPTTEQEAYDWVFIPPKLNVNVILSNFSIGMYANLMEGLRHLTSTTQGGYIHFRFRGRRIGVLLSKASTNGKLSFDVDGKDYGQYDTSYVDDYSTSSTVYNVPYIVATDLPEGEHVLTITKPDNKNVSIQGFLVDDAGAAQTFVRASLNYHDMLDSDAPSWPIAIGTTDTTIRSVDTWLYCATFTNTTAAPINVTLKSTSGVVVGPFPVPANDIRQISGPILFKAYMKAVASSTGITMVLGGQ